MVPSTNEGFGLFCCISEMGLLSLRTPWQHQLITSVGCLFVLWHGKVVWTSWCWGTAHSMAEHFISVFRLIVSLCLTYESVTCPCLVPGPWSLGSCQQMLSFRKSLWRYLWKQQGPPFSHSQIKVLAIAPQVSIDKAHLLLRMSCRGQLGAC